MLEKILIPRASFLCLFSCLFCLVSGEGLFLLCLLHWVLFLFLYFCFCFIVLFLFVLFCLFGLFVCLFLSVLFFLFVPLVLLRKEQLL